MAMELVLNGGPMRNVSLHIRSLVISIFLIAQLIVGIQPAHAEVVLPKGSWLNCAKGFNTTLSCSKNGLSNRKKLGNGSGGPA
jgi:hypothetical protein